MNYFIFHEISPDFFEYKHYSKLKFLKLNFSKIILLSFFINSRLLNTIQITPEPNVITLSKIIPPISEALLAIQSQTTITLQKFTDIERLIKSNSLKKDNDFELFKKELKEQNENYMQKVFVSNLDFTKFYYCCKYI